MKPPSSPVAHADHLEIGSSEDVAQYACLAIAEFLALLDAHDTARLHERFGVSTAVLNEIREELAIEGLERVSLHGPENALARDAAGRPGLTVFRLEQTTPGANETWGVECQLSAGGVPTELTLLGQVDRLPDGQARFGFRLIETM